MNYDDAFTLELVAEQLLDNFNFVAGIVPILTAHIKKVHARCITLYFESVILYTLISIVTVMSLLHFLIQEVPILSKRP